VSDYRVINPATNELERHPSTSEICWWVGVVGGLWLLSMFYLVDRGYRRTLLTQDRMRVHTFVSRRSIRWTEVEGIEKRYHQTRGGDWWDIRVRRVNGRSLTVPGAFTHRRRDVGFEQKLTTINAYWSRARGRSLGGRIGLSCLHRSPIIGSSWFVSPEGAS
jgi:hypothetical protein